MYADSWPWEIAIVNRSGLSLLLLYKCTNVKGLPSYNVMCVCVGGGGGACYIIVMTTTTSYTAKVRAKRSLLRLALFHVNL